MANAKPAMTDKKETVSTEPAKKETVSKQLKKTKLEDGTVRLDR